jgi:hypothetical protein
MYDFTAILFTHNERYIVKDFSLKTDNKTFTFLHHLNQESPQTWLAIQKIVAPTHLSLLYIWVKHKMKVINVLFEAV